MLDGRNNRFFFPWEQMFFLMQIIFIVLLSNMAAVQNLYSRFMPLNLVGCRTTINAEYVSRNFSAVQLGCSEEKEFRCSEWDVFWYRIRTFLEITNALLSYHWCDNFQIAHLGKVDLLRIKSVKVTIIQHKRDGLQSFFTLGNKGAKVTS